jgi:hypothetical protein
MTVRARLPKTSRRMGPQLPALAPALANCLPLVARAALRNTIRTIGGRAHAGRVGFRSSAVAFRRRPRSMAQWAHHFFIEPRRHDEQDGAMNNDK